MFIAELTHYDGTLLHQRFAYRYFGDKVSPLGDLIVFRGSMAVLADGMLDHEDVLNEAFIYSDDAIQFVWECPLLGNDPFGAVAYQRLFNTLIANELSSSSFLNHTIQMHGDDMLVPYQDPSGENKLGKCSVSITHVKDNAAIGHTAINIQAGNKAPAHAFSTNLCDSKVMPFIERVVVLFHELNQSLFIATTKIISK